VLSTLPLAMPLLPAADGNSHTLEEFHVRTSLMLAQADAEPPMDSIQEVDRNLLRVYAAAITGGWPWNTPPKLATRALARMGKLRIVNGRDFGWGVAHAAVS
jgi:hypothetical protein